MHGWDEIEQLGHEIEAKHWTRSEGWPGASSCGWGSEDEKEPEYVRSYETVELGDRIAEVVVACRHNGALKDKTAYRLRLDDDGWRIEEEFEVGRETPTWKHCENPEVQRIVTAPRPLHLGTISQAMDGLMKPAIRLHAVRDDTVTASDSHLAGPFLSNDLKTWPRCERHRTNLVGGLQLWRRDLIVRPSVIEGELFTGLSIPSVEVADMGFPKDRDVLQVFWCPFSHPQDQSAHHLRWLNSSRASVGSTSNPAIRQPPPHLGMLPLPCRLHSEYHPDYPALWEAQQMAVWPEVYHDLQTRLKAGALAGLRQDEDGYTPQECINGFYSDHLGAAGGTKWSGYPCWIQDPEVPNCECGSPMRHLLTVASSIDPTRGHLPVTVESKHPIEWNAELCMGDVGSVYYFICQKCHEGTRFAAVFQCS